MKKIYFLVVFVILFTVTFNFSSSVNKVSSDTSKDKKQEIEQNYMKTGKGSVFSSSTYITEKDDNPVHLGRNRIYRDKNIVPDSIRSSAYYGYVNHLVSKKKINFSKESEALEFYKDTTLRAYGSNSSYFRWNFKRSEKELTTLLGNNLQKYSKDVYTKVENKWVKVPIKNNPIGTLKNIKVVERGQTGIAVSVYIQGSHGEYIYQNKYNVKKFLGGGSYTLHNGKTGKILSKNKEMLPTGFIAFEKVGTDYMFYGGGFGHGVGMSQSGAQDMDKNFSIKYDKILKFYYPNAHLEEADNINLRVAITGSDHNLSHKNATFLAREGLEITHNGKVYKITGGQKGIIKVLNGNIAIYENDKLLTKGQGIVTINPKSGLIGITTIKKNHKETQAPYYTGVMEVKLDDKGGLSIINVVHIEDYLERVLPSEMTGVGGVESLKAQAITARTYALKAAKGTNLKKRGFHLSDTARYQVYNGKDRNDLANRAVKETAGKVLIVNGKYADTQYYSTSSGFGIISDQY